MERFLERAELALIVVVTDEPCVTVTRPEFASDKSEGFHAVVRKRSDDDSPKEVSESWLDTAGIAWR